MSRNGEGRGLQAGDLPADVAEAFGKSALFLVENSIPALRFTPEELAVLQRGVLLDDDEFTF
jgi:hypothetical protein